MFRRYSSRSDVESLYYCTRHGKTHFGGQNWEKSPMRALFCL